MSQNTRWMVRAVEAIIEVLNGTTQAKDITVSLPEGTMASDDLFKGFGKVCERHLWCGSLRRLGILVRESTAAGHVENGEVIITYKRDPADLTKVSLSVPKLPFGKVAVLKSKLPIIRIDSTSEETNLESFFRGLQDLPWQELQHRLQSEAAIIPVRDLNRSVQAGSTRMTLNEGMTHDYKCDATLSLEMKAFSSIAFHYEEGEKGASQDMSSTLTRLLASVKIGAKANAVEEAESPLHFSEGEACLLFGIPDKSNLILGHELMFDNLDLVGCQVFPPLLADEISAEKIAVRIWPETKPPSELPLQVYTGNDDHYKVVKSEQGKAWRANDKLLRIKPRSTSDEMPDKENDELPGADSVDAALSPWMDTSIENYPSESWLQRHLLRFVVRPQDDCKYIQGTFFDNAAGFLLPNGFSLSCLGVYFRLRPSRWQGRFSNGSGTLRYEVGNCCGTECAELFDKRFEAFTSQVKDDLQSTVSSMRKSVAIEFSQVPAFLQAGLERDPSIDVVMFVPLDKFQQIRSASDRSYTQYKSIASYCHQLSQLANLLDVVPAGFHELDPFAGTATGDYSPMLYTEEQKKQIARKYYTCDAGEAISMLPQEMLRKAESWIVWTYPMGELLAKYEGTALHPQSSSLVEVQSLLRKAGVTTALSALRQRILEKGGRALLFTECDEANVVSSVVATVEKTPGSTGPVAVLMDCHVADPRGLLGSLKDRCKPGVFLVYHRMYRHGRIPKRIERTHRILISPLWSLPELERLIESLVRTFSGASNTCVKGGSRPLNDTALVKALNDLFEHAKTDISCRHVFLFVFVATTGVFHPLPQLIKTVRQNANEVGVRLWESPKRVFDAVAFVSATCPLGWGVPYSNVKFDSLLQNDWAKNVLVKKEGRMGSSNHVPLVRYVHPYFARIHLLQLAAEASGKGHACFDKPFPPPKDLVPLWSTCSTMEGGRFCIRDDLKILVEPGDYYDFFSPIFAQKNALSPLAEHFRQAKESRELLKMCEGLIEPMHYDVLKSKLLRRESTLLGCSKKYYSLRDAANAAKKAYDADLKKSFLTAHNLAITHAIAYDSLPSSHPEKRHHLHEGLKYFEEALDRACVSANKGVHISQQEMDVGAQMSKYFGDSEVFKSGSTKLKEFLRELPERAKELYAAEEDAEEERVLSDEWRFLMQWSDMF